MIYIYNPKELQNPISLNGEFGKFKLNPVAWYSEWTSDLIATDIKFNHPKLVNGELVEKTQEELKLEGIVPLVNGEVIENNSITVKPKPTGYKIEWIYPNWVETATEEEIAEIEFNASVSFYNSELEFASKATAELVCEIITNEMYESVKAYMRAIDPYAPKAARFTAISRPALFDKYK